VKTVLFCAALLSLLAAGCRTGDGLSSADAGHGATAIRPEVTDEKDAIILAKLREHARGEAAKLTAEHFQTKEEPEMLCWVELKQMNMSLVAYELSRDVTHLRDFAAALASLRASLRKGPDGFLGWRGKPIKSLRDPAHPDAEIDEIQTSFRAVAVLSRFVEIVEAEDRLRSEFGHLRPALIDLMENHLVRKWEARGYWVDLGDRGGVYRWNAAYLPGKAGISLPWEKLSIMVDGLLGLYRATGNDDHMRKAVMIGTRHKRCMQMKDGRYLWYNWVPAGKWDVHPDDPAKWKSWLGRSPIAGWYSAEAGIAVALYHHGVVFDRTDIERILKTQMEVCWNGDAESPEYLNVEGKPSNRKGQRFLCPALAPFSDRLAAFVFTGPLQQERVAKSDNAWHGGVIAADWLWDKYVMFPAARGGRPMYAEHGARFLAKRENRNLVERLTFEVTEPGFQMPMTPQQMDPMPEAPAPKGG